MKLCKCARVNPEFFSEPRFFITERVTRSGEGNTRKRPATLAQYLALFADAGPGQQAGEASPQYLRYAEAPAAIAALNPDAKIIAPQLRAIRLATIGINIAAAISRYTRGHGM